MSGPKVVRVVSREELVAAGELLLARLDEALAQWRASGISMKQLLPAEVEVAAARREELARLLRKDEFKSFRNAATSEIAYLQADHERRREVAEQAEAMRIKAELRTRENAYALIRALKSKQATPAPDLLTALHGVATGAGRAVGGPSAEEVLRDAFRALSAAGDPAGAKRDVTEKQRALAGRLAAGLPDTSFDAWKAAQVAPEQDRRFEDLSLRLAVLATVGDPNAVRSFTEKLSLLQDSDAGVARNMRLDSLVLEVEEAVSEAKAHSKVRVAAAELIRMLEVACAEESTILRADLARAAEKGGYAARSLIETGQGMLKAALKRSTADARRQAVLRGLGQLGYEVRENMAAAWAQNGRVVLLRQDRAGYGVELAGSAEIERIQVRAVALAQDRDRGRDLDAETLWCSEFSRLRADLESSGGQMVIEKAAGVGEVPLRVVESSEHDRMRAQIERDTGLKG